MTWTAENDVRANDLFVKVSGASGVLARLDKTRDEEELEEALGDLRRRIRDVIRRKLEPSALEPLAREAEPLVRAAYARAQLSEDARAQAWEAALSRCADLTETLRSAEAGDVVPYAQEALGLLGRTSEVSRVSLGSRRRKAEQVVVNVPQVRAQERDVRTALQHELIRQVGTCLPSNPATVARLLETEALTKARFPGWAAWALEVAPDVRRVPWALALTAATYDDGNVGDITGLGDDVMETAITLLGLDPGGAIEAALAAARGLEE